MNGHEHIGTIESERSNALERIVENGHGMVTFTVRSRSRSKNERITVFKSIFNLSKSKIFDILVWVLGSFKDQANPK
jgi:hypothetical protein